MRLVNSMRKQSGIALVTTLLLLMLMSAMLVGFIFLVTEGQRLSGLDQDQVRAFYAAESGMEKLTNDLGNLFTNTYSPTGVQVNALTAAPPILNAPDGIKFQNAVGANGYTIAFPPDGNGNPLPRFAQITSGSSPYQGMSALETTYTLTVEARTGNNADVKLTRTTQTVGIPLFQFGIFSQTDLSFFPGPNFNFGGRVATNGNLFLDSGGPAGALPTQTTVNQLWLASPVTAHLNIFRNCLSNTNPESTTGKHPGSVEITKGGGVFQALGFGQGSLSGCLGAAANPNWPTISASFNGNLRSGVKLLNLTVTLLGNGAAQPIDIVRRPVAGEDNTNPGVLGERYFSMASLRILLSDNAADITGLPCVSPDAPFNLAHLARPVLGATGWSTYTDSAALLAAMTAAGTIPLPLAASGAAPAAGAYVQGYVPTLQPSNNPTGAKIATTGVPGGDGYWQPNGTPIITGYIKIDAQTAYGSPCGTYKDVTQEILSLGYAGKNINPVPQSLDGATLNPMWGNSAAYAATMQLGAAPALPAVPDALTTAAATPTVVQLSGQTNQVAGVATAMAAGTFTGPSTNPATAGYNTGTCLDPHPNAVIRLERIRGNPSSVPFAAGTKGVPAANLPLRSTVAQVCGVDPATKTILAGWTPAPYDFWPNVLYDTREGYNRQPSPTGNFVNQVTLGGVMNYIELDVSNLARWFKGNIGATGPATQDPNVAPNNFVVYVSDRRSNYYGGGAFAGGWPPLSPSGHETGEFGYSDFVDPADIRGCPNGTLDAGEDVASQGVFYNYGETSFPPGLVDSTGLSTAGTLFANSIAAVVADPLCGAAVNGGLPWPRTFLATANEARENPSPLFRRALKMVNGSLISLPVCPGGVTCGLTIATENPAYVQGDYNANSAGGGLGDPNVAASVVADAFTFLSNDWNDVNSFNSPFNTGGRSETLANVYYRLGVVAGKGVSFPIPGWDTVAIDGSQDFGTDGGVHNFLRYLESWGGKLNYTGSIISLYFNRQAVGLYNSGGNNYSPPNRGYSFDNNFLNPTLLPPRTPMFRDVNTTGFTQLLLANQ
jgi:type IV pilus assembly PilX-like protein